MTQIAFHPAMLELLRLQARGRRRRIWKRFCQPRRLLLSAVATVLAVAWLGNAALTVWLREAASPESLRALLSLGLVLYTGWHLARTAFFRPQSPVDWAPEEREQLAAMPLAPRDLVAYQIAAVTATTSLKAGLFTALMLPDLRCVPLALMGIVLAMLLLEWLRMAIEIGSWSLSRRAFVVYRATVVSGLAAGGLALAATIMRHETLLTRVRLGEGLRGRIVELVVTFDRSAIGWVGWPFRPFVDLIVADRVNIQSLRLSAAALAIVAGLAVLVVGLYSFALRQVIRREVRGYRQTHARLSPDASQRAALGPGAVCSRDLKLSRMLRMRGAGPVAWRQAVGARRQWGSLVTAMIAPAVMALLPVFVVADARNAFIATLGALAFYTFLLLPTAVRFDFRRDLDRLATLKGLPISPTAMAVGQIVVPVLIATLFQATVLAATTLLRDLPADYVALAVVMMIPMNVLVFAVDNLIYLLYPYRVQQEGLEIFLRTILTFTGKGLLFAAGLGAIATWAFSAAALARAAAPWTPGTLSAYTIFLLGMIVGPTLLATAALLSVSRIYGRLNPIEDLPR